MKILSIKEENLLSKMSQKCSFIGSAVYIIKFEVCREQTERSTALQRIGRRQKHNSTQMASEPKKYYKTF